MHGTSTQQRHHHRPFGFLISLHSSTTTPSSIILCNKFVPLEPCRPILNPEQNPARAYLARSIAPDPGIVPSSHPQQQFRPTVFKIHFPESKFMQINFIIYDSSRDLDKCNSSGNRHQHWYCHFRAKSAWYNVMWRNNWGIIFAPLLTLRHFPLVVEHFSQNSTHRLPAWPNSLDSFLICPNCFNKSNSPWRRESAALVQHQVPWNCNLSFLSPLPLVK